MIELRQDDQQSSKENSDEVIIFLSTRLRRILMDDR